jgi:hypothetical protein
MNLFYNPSISEFAALFGQSGNATGNYNIVVDFDGEVLLDREGALTDAKLKKFKFYFKGLHESLHAGYRSARKLKLLNQIYKNLLFCWEQGVSGSVECNEISRIQNYRYRIEQHEIRKKAYPVQIGRTFPAMHGRR